MFTEEGLVLQGLFEQYKAKVMPITSDIDKVFCYSAMLLELGLLMQSLLDLVHYPNRDHGLRLLKLLMVYLKCHNTRSKYAGEIMRLLVHQHFTLSERRANEEFYGHFVHTENGCIIPADLQMEFIVRELKRNIHHMFSGQTSENIDRRSGAIYPLSQIGKCFDRTAGVVKRYKVHKSITQTGDIQEVLQTLTSLKPFKKQYGRCHHSFKKIQSSLLQNLVGDKYKKWLQTKLKEFSYEIGN